jgi:hypothetical protein
VGDCVGCEVTVAGFVVAIAAWFIDVASRVVVEDV